MQTQVSVTVSMVVVVEELFAPGSGVVEGFEVAGPCGVVVDTSVAVMVGAVTRSRNFGFRRCVRLVVFHCGRRANRVELDPGPRSSTSARRDQRFKRAHRHPLRPHEIAAPVSPPRFALRETDREIHLLVIADNPRPRSRRYAATVAFTNSRKQVRRHGGRRAAIAWRIRGKA